MQMFLIPTDDLKDPDNGTPDPLPSDNRPWLSEKAYEKALDRIKGGETEVYDKTLAAFQVNDEWKLQLKLAAAK